MGNTPSCDDIFISRSVLYQFNCFYDMEEKWANYKKNRESAILPIENVLKMSKVFNILENQPCCLMETPDFFMNENREIFIKLINVPMDFILGLRLENKCKNNLDFKMYYKNLLLGDFEIPSSGLFRFPKPCAYILLNFLKYNGYLKIQFPTYEPALSVRFVGVGIQHRDQQKFLTKKIPFYF